MSFPAYRPSLKGYKDNITDFLTKSLNANFQAVSFEETIQTTFKGCQLVFRVLKTLTQGTPGGSLGEEGGNEAAGNVGNIYGRLSREKGPPGAGLVTLRRHEERCNSPR